MRNKVSGVGPPWCDIMEFYMFTEIAPEKVMYFRLMDNQVWARGVGCQESPGLLAVLLSI